MADLGELRRTLSVRWERYIGLVLITNAILIFWTLLLVTGRIGLGIWLLTIMTVKMAVLMKLWPAAMRKVEVYEEGLRIYDVSFRADVAWEELEGYYLTIVPMIVPVPGEGKLARKIRLEAVGRMASIPDDIEDFDDLLAQIQQRVDERELEAVQGKLENDEEVYFGPIRLHREIGATVASAWEWNGLKAVADLARSSGLAQNADPPQQRVWPWHEIERATQLGGMLFFASDPVCPLGLVRNPHLFARVLEQHGVDVSGLRPAVSPGGKS